VVLSRFHWHTLTIWTEPTQDRGKPSIEFTTHVHTPVVKSAEKDVRMVEIEPDLPIRERIDVVFLYLPRLKSAIESARFSRRCEDSLSVTVSGSVPEKYTLDLSKIKYAAIIGRYPLPEELPPILRDRVFGAR
jgi:hypothetical protein